MGSAKGNSGIFYSPFKSIMKASAESSEPPVVPPPPIQTPTSATDSTPAGEMAAPTPDNETIKRNARREAARRSSVSGRVSTFLSSDKMGG